jgi:hypothetical protein
MHYDHQTLRDLIQILREGGVTRLVMPDGLILEMGPAPLQSQPESKPAPKPEDADDIAFWSAE